MKELSHQLWRVSRVLVVPVLRDDEEVSARNAQAAVRQRFIQDDLGMGRIEFTTIEDQSEVDVMKTHRAVVGPADATEQKLVLSVCCRLDILEALGCFPDRLDECVVAVPISRHACV